jgi:hypothetical protein
MLSSVPIPLEFFKFLLGHLINLLHRYYVKQFIVVMVYGCVGKKGFTRSCGPYSIYITTI